MKICRAELYAPETEESSHVGIALDWPRAKKMCEAEIEESEFLHWVTITPNLIHGYFDEGLDDKGNPKELFNYFIIYREKVK